MRAVQNIAQPLKPSFYSRPVFINNLRTSVFTTNCPKITRIYFVDLISYRKFSKKPQRYEKRPYPLAKRTEQMLQIWYYLKWKRNCDDGQFTRARLSVLEQMEWVDVKEAALLLHAIEPLDFSRWNLIRIEKTDVPELSEAYKTFYF